MLVTINTKVEWENYDLGLLDERNGITGSSYGDNTKEEIEKALIEINKFLIARLEEFEE